MPFDDDNDIDYDENMDTAAAFSSDDDTVCKTGNEDIDQISPRHSEDENTLTNSPTFKVGDSFDTFEELEKSIKKFEEAHFVKFWKREARTVETASKRVNQYINPRLKYYQLNYACIHGGQAFRPRGKGHKTTS